MFEAEFRGKLNKRFTASHKLKNATNEPNSADYNICIAIMSKVAGPLELPFFSRVSFRHAVTDLRNRGYNGYKLKIEQFE